MSRVKELEEPAEANLSITLDSARHAEIVYNSLKVDKEPKNFVEKELKVEGNSLHVHLKAKKPKNLRNAITSFFENYFLVRETISEFDNYDQCGKITEEERSKKRTQNEEDEEDSDLDEEADHEEDQ